MKFVFNCEEVVLVVLSDEVDSQAEVAEAPGAADSVQVGLCKLGKVEVDNDVDRDDIDTASEQIGADQAAGVSILEVVEDSVAIGLRHA